ncbi:MAG: serine hydrolase [Acidimicrobiia bacterium]|nr:serine hydrolase [Acidimicrobiia bacterium]
MTIRRIAFLALLLAASLTAQSLDGLDTFVEEQMKEWKVPGVAIAVVKDGKVILSKGYGQRNIKENLPVTPKTLFAIGSSSKAFTAISLALLADDGKLEWDKPVRDFLPEFRLYDQTMTERMTPVDLLTHRSGLPRHDLVWYSSPLSRQQLYERLRHLEPSKDLRTTFQYQNLMYMTAGYLAGRLQDITWEDAVRRRIFTPLGMSQSNFSVNDSQKTNDFALPYKKNKEEIVESPFRNIDAVGPAGCINSNLEDMTHYLRMNLDDGKFNGKQFLSAQQIRMMQTAHMPIAGEGRRVELGPTSYGLGWFITTYRGQKLVHHGGNIDGFSALVTFMPRGKMGMIILTNMNGSPLPTVLSYNVYDRLLGLEPVNWTARIREDEKLSKQGEEEAKKKGYTPQKPGTAPSHPLGDYAGDYEHPGYGVMKVTRDGEKLHIALNGLATPVRHFHYDVFEGVEDPLNPLQKMKLQFHSSLEGNIESVTIPLESTLKPIAFTRLADSSMRKREFLEPLTGQYSFGPMTATVALQGDSTLTLTIPGQPRYELVPIRATIFQVKGLTGFTVEFKPDEAIFHQPNGTFAAKRKP